MLGMDPLYFYTDVAGEQSYATAIGQSPKLNHPQTLEHELLVQNHFQSQLLSPIHRNHHQRRDSFFPCSPSSASTSGGPSPYQAVVQPYLSDTKMAQRGQMSHPMAMGRSKSQQSLNSPEQTQHHQHRASLGHGSEFGASSMSRTSTQQSSNPAAYQTWLTAPRPNIISPPAELTGYASWDTEYALPMSAATVSHYGPRPNTSNRANLSHTQSSSGGDHMAEIGSISETFHQARNRSGTFGDSTFSEIPYLHDQTSLRPRPRTQSFPQHVFYNNDLLRHSPPHITTIQTASLSPLLPTPRKRRRPSTLSPTSPSDPVVGHVTAAGKFRCSDTTCADLSFGRQADFRRHYEHAHAAKKMEYFCTVDGCARSQRPAGGGRSKGRSFGSREDKMREHVRTVHEKGVGKRRKVDEEDGESEGWVEEM